MQIKQAIGETKGHFGVLPPADGAAERTSRPLSSAQIKTQFFDAFGKFMTTVQEMIEAEQTPVCLDDIRRVRDRVMSVREKHLGRSGDTGDDWWQIITNLVSLTNLLEALDLDALANETFLLTADASSVMKIIKEEMEHGNHAGY